MKYKAYSRDGSFLLHVPAGMSCPQKLQTMLTRFYDFFVCVTVMNGRRLIWFKQVWVQIVRI